MLGSSAVAQWLRPKRGMRALLPGNFSVHHNATLSASAASRSRATPPRWIFFVKDGKCGDSVLK
jgi:hypothetical protein